MEAIKRIGRTGIVPVVVLEDAAHAVPTANALKAGGVDVMEITMRTAAGLDAIKKAVRECPDVLVGAGTVIGVEQCKACVDAGAQFIVSPGFDRGIVRWCAERGIACIPGCATPSEIMAALSYGLKALKFFPANIYGGVPGLKALSGPFPDVRFIPTGGVNLANLAEYGALRYVHAVGGSWLCPKAHIHAGDFEGIAQAAKNSREEWLKVPFRRV